MPPTTPIKPPVATPAPTPKFEIKEDPPSLSLTPDDLHELSGLLGSNIQSKSDLLRAVRNVSTVSVDGVEITLEPAVLTRFKSRYSASRMAYPEFVRQEVLRMIREFVGL